MLLSGRRVTIALCPKSVSARLRMNEIVSGYSIISPSTSMPPPSFPSSVAKDRPCDVRAVGRAGAVERLDPECPLVVAMERMVPGEAHAAMHLDRALACRDRCLRGIRLRRARGELGLPVILGDAPRRPVRERARELRLHIRVRELVRDRLVRADRPPELLAALRVLDTEGQRSAGDADRLQRKRRERAPPGARDDRRGGGRRREQPGVIVFEGDAAETTRPVDRVEDADQRPGVVALREVQPDAIRPARLDHEGVDPPGVGHEIRLATQEPAIAGTTYLDRRP